MKNILSKNNLFALCLLGLAVTSCTQEMEEVAQSGKSIKMVVNASREDITVSRTSHAEVDGNMATTWAAGDQLLVTNTAGNPLGVINLVEGAGQKDGQFAGDLVGLGSDGTLKLNYFYLGNAVTEPAKFDGNLSIAEQDGALTSLNQYDVLSSSVDVNIQDGTSYVENIGLKRNFLFAHFTLNFPEGVAMNGEAITISGTNVKNGATIDLTNATYAATDGPITVSGTNGDFYITLIPSMDVALEFSVTIGGKEYTRTLSAVELKRNAYIRKAANEGIPVAMATEEVPEQPGNPGNTDNWGSKDDMAPVYTGGDDSSAPKTADAGGWTVNVDIYGNGGFSDKYITYESNGIEDDLLTSNEATDAIYFQWGRWLGFPSTCGLTHFNDGGSADGYYPEPSQYLKGVNTGNLSLGYIWDSGLVPSYATCWMGNNDWTKDRVINCSIVFGKVYGAFSTTPLDYMGANENCSWEDRSGNPCPTGYRIPTAAELSALIPSTGSISGSYAEVKTIDGIQYAMQWKVNTSGTVPCVEITSVPTTLSNVSVDDAIFEGATTVKLHAYGYLDNEAGFGGKGTTGVYWSSESAANTMSNTNGLGAKYLQIDFSGTTAEMYMDVAPRSFGATIIPIKDSDAVATSISPWFPLSGL